jgi:MYXO-CTERM domain-containing protein
MRRISLTVLALLSFALARPARAADPCKSNLMIVLDRSCSMQKPPKAGVTQSKWQIAGAAIQTLTTKYMGKLDFGLIMFPDETAQSCLQDGNIYVNVGPDRETQVVSAVMGTQPNGPCVTDIKPAFDQVETDPAFATKYDGTGPRGFVLFISDGEQTCGGTNAQITASIKKLYDDGWPSYVVGFGGAVSPAALGMFATAGGVGPVSGDGGARGYYQADDAASLDAALDQIAGAVLAGEFTGCAGVPCPDGRCFVSGEQCVSGSCIAPTSPIDASANGDGGSLGGDGGLGGHQGSGCSCKVGGAGAPGLGALLLFALVGLALVRRRRA